MSGARLWWRESKCGVSAAECCHWVDLRCQLEGHQLLVSDTGSVICLTDITHTFYCYDSTWCETKLSASCHCFICALSSLTACSRKNCTKFKARHLCSWVTESPGFQQNVQILTGNMKQHSFNTASTTQLRPFYGPLYGTTRVSRYQKDEPFWNLLKKRLCGGSSISWTAAASAGPYASHLHFIPDTQFFMGQMPLLSPSQQCQSTEGNQFGLD